MCVCACVRVCACLCMCAVCTRVCVCVVGGGMHARGAWRVGPTIAVDVDSEDHPQLRHDRDTKSCHLSLVIEETAFARSLFNHLIFLP